MRVGVWLLSLGVALAFTAVSASSDPTAAVAQGVAACDDGLDNDGDGLTDWLDDPTCNSDPSGVSEGARPACSDGLDNDQDGAIDRDDPGCRGRAAGTDETNPVPVPSRLSITVARPLGCGIESGVEVLPDLTPRRLFPFAPVSVRLRGIDPRTRAIDVNRALPVGADNGYLFDRLRPGRYELTGSYPGDSFRLPSTTATRRVTLPESRCRVYFTGGGSRGYRPRVVYFGASQRIFAIRWKRWGGPAAVGTGIRPVNDCIPFCAAGSITDHAVNVRMSRRRLCNGYIQYLTMRLSYRGRPPSGAPRSEMVNFGYQCS